MITRMYVQVYYCICKLFCEINNTYQCLYNSTVTATSLMIPQYSLTSESSFANLTWKSPKYRPENYEFTYVCIANNTCLAKTCSLNSCVVKPKIINLISETTSVIIRDLRPDSICILKLVTFFNPASIDSGIVLTVKTLPPNTSKCNQGMEFVTVAFHLIQRIGSTILSCSVENYLCFIYLSYKTHISALINLYFYSKHVRYCQHVCVLLFLRYHISGIIGWN